MTLIAIISEGGIAQVCKSSSTKAPVKSQPCFVQLKGTNKAKGVLSQMTCKGYHGNMGCFHKQLYTFNTDVSFTRLSYSFQLFKWCFHKIPRLLSEFYFRQLNDLGADCPLCPTYTTCNISNIGIAAGHKWRSLSNLCQLWRYND